MLAHLGVMEIKKCCDMLRNCLAGQSAEVLPLHSNLTSNEQQLVFKPPRNGFRKIVVATNIAETSITMYVSLT